jgi:hypothetical protein
MTKHDAGRAQPQSLFRDLPAGAFPFTIYAFPENSTADLDPVWVIEVPGPGVLKIPGIEQTGQRVRLVVNYADGTTVRGEDVL